MSGKGNVAGFLYLQFYVYVYVQSCPWAHLSRSWGGPILYRCWFISSSSPAIFDIYIYRYVGMDACMHACMHVCIYFIYVYYILLQQGITGVPGGSVINEDTSPGPV